MDTKTIAFGAAVIVASVGGSALVGKDPATKEVAVSASEAPADVTAATVANLGNDIASRKVCVLERVGTDKGVVLQWACNGAVLGPKDQAELAKIGGPDATQIAFDPRDDGKGGVTLAPVVTTGGVKPDTSPVPVEAVAVKADKP